MIALVYLFIIVLYVQYQTPPFLAFSLRQSPTVFCLSYGSASRMPFAKLIRGWSRL